MKIYGHSSITIYFWCHQPNQLTNNHLPPIQLNSSISYLFLSQKQSNIYISLTDFLLLHIASKITKRKKKQKNQKWLGRRSESTTRNASWRSTSSASPISTSRSTLLRFHNLLQPSRFFYSFQFCSKKFEFSAPLSLAFVKYCVIKSFSFGKRNKNDWLINKLTVLEGLLLIAIDKVIGWLILLWIWAHWILNLWIAWCKI